MRNDERLCAVFPLKSLQAGALRSAHNAGVEGSSPSLSTKIKQLDLSPEPRQSVCRFLCDETTETAAHSSVLTERPTDHRQPMDTTVLGYAMALGLAVLVAVVIWKFLEGRADRGER